MNLARICVAVAFGFILGIWLFRTSPVNANPQEGGKAHVFIVPVEVFDTKTPTSKNIPGVRIAGISCIAKPQTKLPDAALCYVATAIE